MDIDDVENAGSDTQAARSRADLLMALLLVALGIATFYLSYTMPRLENRGIHPSTIPGLVPMMLGAALVVLAGVLSWQTWRNLAPGGWGELLRVFGSMVVARVIAAMILVLVYATILIGWLPFWAASMIFIFAFIVTFEVLLADAPLPGGRSALWALATAVVFGGGIYLVFTEIFLVRLP